MKNIPWEEIRKRYENEKVSYQQLGEAYGISYKTVGEHARKEKWTKGKQIPNAADVCLSSAARQLARRLESAENGGEVDYIHGEDVTVALSKKENTVGILFDGISKSELFPYVKEHGALPRKTFSMGEAHDKRYYMEARKIK